MYNYYNIISYNRAKINRNFKIYKFCLLFFVKAGCLGRKIILGGTRVKNKKPIKKSPNVLMSIIIYKKYE